MRWMDSNATGSAPTSWSRILDAAAGGEAAREEFARRYLPVVRAYLRARWRLSPLVAEADDAVQEVFLECLKVGGALGRAEPRRPGGFRAFLHGIARNVAGRIEERRRPERALTSTLADAEPGLQEEAAARAFLREWAGAVVEQAREVLRERARILGADAARRIEILRLRFEEDLPVRTIAERLALEPARVHKLYALAREEFRAALREVVAGDHPGTAAEIESECAALLDCLAGPAS